MGLAGPRKRRKLGQDPNNTTWARSSDSFGAKILSAQGWTPGSYLGAQDAPQAEHYSAANASHIRVALKDNNLGLGARPGNSDRDNFGSGIFSDILGRLNGKGEKEVGEEQQERADLGRKLYAQQKYGATRFVRGGFLVGDKIEDATNEQGPQTDPPATSTVILAPVDSLSAANKRQQPSTEALSLLATEKLSSTRNVPRKHKEEYKVKEKKSKKVKKRSQDVSAPQDEHTTHKSTNMMSPRAVSRELSAEVDQISERKDIGRQQRRLERRARKEARRQKKANSRDIETVTSNDSDDKEMTPTPTVIRTNDSLMREHEEAPALHDRSAPKVLPGSRHHVRQKYIQQKRMASMDPRSLSEILMVKF